MDHPRELTRLLGPLAVQRRTSVDPPQTARSDQSFSVLAICAAGRLEERLRHAVRRLGQEVRFARTFGTGLDVLRERFYDLVVLAKSRNGMDAKGFVREAKRVREDSVVVIAAPCSEYEQLVEVMLEGAYDFLPEDADDYQLRLMLGRAMDHSRLRRKSGELERALDLQTTSLRQRVQELVMLNEMAQDMSSVPDLDEVLGRALRRTLDAFGSECGSFLILDPVGHELVVRAAAGRGSERLIGRRRKLGEGISGKVADGGAPVLVTDVAHDSRFSADALGPQGERHYQSQSFIAVPLICHGRLLGEMNITERGEGEPFSPDDLRLLSILAGHVASAINGALAADELKRANQTLKQGMCSARESLRTTHVELDQAKGLAHAIMRSLPAAVAAFDTGLRCSFANEAVGELLGVRPGLSLKGQPARSSLATLANAVVDVVDRGSTRTLSLQSQLAGCGSENCLNVVVAPLRLADGTISGATVVATPGGCPLLTPPD